MTTLEFARNAVTVSNTSRSDPGGPVGTHNALVENMRPFVVDFVSPFYTIRRVFPSRGNVIEEVNPSPRKLNNCSQHISSAHIPKTLKEEMFCLSPHLF